MKELKKRAGNYPYTGTPGPRDPILPVNKNPLIDALAPNKAGICEKWQKGNLYKRFETFEVARYRYKLTRKATGAGA